MFGYLIRLPEPKDGYTHGWVYRQLLDDGLRVDMKYGTVDGEGEFVPSTLGVHDHVHLTGDRMEDFVEQVRAIPGRPADLPDHDFRSGDVVTYLEENQVSQQARITARREEKATALAAAEAGAEPEPEV